MSSEEQKPDSRLWPSLFAAVGVGIVFGLGGFLLMTFPAGRAMGQGLFIVLPFASGVAIALVASDEVSRVRGAAVIAGAASVLIGLTTLVSARLEGLLCAVLAFPIIFAALMIGIGIGILLRKLTRLAQDSRLNSLLLLAMPVVVVASHRFEMKSLQQTRQQSITTTIHLPAPPEEVWRNIQELDRVAGRKPFLMHLGLPIPRRCVLLGTSVGSTRICYFDQGYIEESVLEWQPPHRMRVSINRANMPGRHWLGFDGAEYDLKADGDGTALTRVTTIQSSLYPAWYWGRLERWGVSSEHEYLFSDLARRFPTGKAGQ